ncbi:MAG: hypothetical protein R6V03_09680 [Kiritimatiellia bacterium]
MNMYAQNIATKAGLSLAAGIFLCALTLRGGETPAHSPPPWKYRQSPSLTWAPAAGIELTKLNDRLKGIIKAPHYREELEKLEKDAAGWDDPGKVEEARKIIGHIVDYGEKMLERGREFESQHPRTAAVVYELLSRKYRGMAVGKAADERKESDEFARQKKAWVIYERLLRYERSFKEIPGAERNVKDRRWYRLNRLIARKIEVCLEHLRKYPDTAAALMGGKVAAGYGIKDEKLNSLIEKNAEDKPAAGE